uniref:Uncharacterized protein n=1 Tax=Anopheles merus TaxID=30066 RepID=A0A182UZ79_ANOME
MGGRIGLAGHGWDGLSEQHWTLVELYENRKFLRHASRYLECGNISGEPRGGAGVGKPDDEPVAAASGCLWFIEKFLQVPIARSIAMLELPGDDRHQQCRTARTLSPGVTMQIVKS